jgi:hypothetical protein
MSLVAATEEGTAPSVLFGERSARCARHHLWRPRGAPAHWAPDRDLAEDVARGADDLARNQA